MNYRDTKYKLYEMTDLPSCPYYQVTKCGKIYSNKTNKFMKGATKKNGYKQLVIRDNGRYRTILVHRAVMEAWIGKSDLTVNHIDGDKSNNNLSNLEYLTNAANMRHASEVGLLKCNPVQVMLDGVGLWFPSGRSCSKYTGLSQKQVSQLHTGIRNRAGKYKKSTQFNEC